MSSKRKQFQCPFWDHETFAELLCEAGWSSSNDAQWSNLKAMCDEALDGCRFNKEARTVQAAPSDDKPADPYSGELGGINLRNLATQMHQALGLLKRQGCYHPAMGTMREEGFKHGLNLSDAPDHIGDATGMAQAAPSDREKRLEEALRVIAMHEDMPGAKIARAALADTTNNDAKK